MLEPKGGLSRGGFLKFGGFALGQIVINACLPSKEKLTAEPIPLAPLVPLYQDTIEMINGGELRLKIDVQRSTTEQINALELRGQYSGLYNKLAPEGSRQRNETRVTLSPVQLSRPVNEHVETITTAPTTIYLFPLKRAGEITVLEDNIYGVNQEIRTTSYLNKQVFEGAVAALKSIYPEFAAANPNSAGINVVGESDLYIYPAGYVPDGTVDTIQLSFEEQDGNRVYLIETAMPFTYTDSNSNDQRGYRLSQAVHLNTAFQPNYARVEEDAIYYFLNASVITELFSGLTGNNQLASSASFFVFAKSQGWSYSEYTQLVKFMQNVSRQSNVILHTFTQELYENYQGYLGQPVIPNTIEQ